MKTVFIHPERCIGCKQCELACTVAHSQTHNLFLAVFEIPPPRARIHAEPGLDQNTAFPNKCRHCNPAPCQLTCPTSAIQRPVDFPEIVSVDVHRCIACGMCAMVCPFDAVTYHPVAAAPERLLVAVKCDACLQRQRLGLIPACVEVCKVGALEFGDINEIVRDARQEYSRLVLQALGAAPQQVEPLSLPDSIEIWRAWGAAAAHLNGNGGNN